MSLKTCPRCGGIKPTTVFSKDKKRPDGLNFYCKDCCNKMAKEYRDSPRGIYQNIKGRSTWMEKHNYGRFKPINLTRNEFINWYESEPKICAYCDLAESDLWILQEEFDNRVERLTVDCKDNSLGYQLDNIVLACERCNFIKGNLFDFDTMREIGQTYVKPIWLSIKHRTKREEAK